MTKRQYLVHHILHLSAALNEITDRKQRENAVQALHFYTEELKRHDENRRKTQYKQ